MCQKSLKRMVRGGKWVSILLILPLMLMGQTGIQAQEEEEQEQEEQQQCSTVTICPDGAGEEGQECRTVKVCGEGEAVDPERLAELVERIRSLAERRRGMEAVQAQELAEQYRAQAEDMREREADRARDMAERYSDMAARYRDLGQQYRGQVAWVRSGARIGISLDGTQDPDLDLQGAEITSVVEDSPADEAGLQEGDIVTHIDGHSLLEPIPDEDEDREDWGDSSLPVTRLISLARDLEPGDVVEIRYLRDGDSHSVSVEAAEVDSPQFYIGRWPRGEQGGIFRWDPEEGEAWTYNFDPGAFEDLRLHFESDSFPNIIFERGSPTWFMPQMEGRLEGLLEGELAGGLHLAFESCGEGAFFGNCVAGLELRELNEGLGGYFGTTEGVLVLSVGEESELGIEPGDVILAIAGRDVEDPSDVRRILGSYDEDEEIEFSVRRADRVITVSGVR